MGISIISIYSLNVENQYCKYYSLIINLLIYVRRTLCLYSFNKIESNRLLRVGANVTNKRIAVFYKKK